MEIEPLLNERLKTENNIFSNIVGQFIELLQNSLKTNELKENLQNQYAQILKNDETIEYNIFSRVTGKDYTILSFQDKGENIIKIPNLLLPKETNSRTVLNYKNGEFEINQDKTKINNRNWEKEQKTEEILKEDRIYFVDSHRNDYTEVIAVDNGKEYKFNFMEAYIGRRLKIDVNEGDYIIAKDGKFEKYEGNVKIKDKKTERIIENRKQEIENDKLNREYNLKEGKEFLVKEQVNSSNFIVESIDDKRESYMGFYTNKTELEDLQVQGIEDIYCYESNNATITNLQEGDKLVVKNGKIIKEGTENLLENNISKSSQYRGKSGQIYFVDKVGENSITITNINDLKTQTVKREDGINIESGDFIKTKNVGYERYDGSISIENTKIKDYVNLQYNHML